jgi:hypothetical protein
VYAELARAALSGVVAPLPTSRPADLTVADPVGLPLSLAELPTVA